MIKVPIQTNLVKWCRNSRECTIQVQPKAPLQDKLHFWALEDHEKFRVVIVNKLHFFQEILLVKSDPTNIKKCEIFESENKPECRYGLYMSNFKSNN